MVFLRVLSHELVLLLAVGLLSPLLVQLNVRLMLLDLLLEMLELVTQWLLLERLVTFNVILVLP